MPALFAVTAFVGSALLFLVQPMFARMVLPLLGGASSVWNTAMVFYQAALLAGYAWAHASVTRLGVRRQIPWQLVLLLLPLPLLPIALPAGWIPPVDHSPLSWLLALMTVAVGLPFLAVATMSPLLQRWFAATGHPHHRDPYFLYAASNLGSLLALLAYPFAIEPHWSLARQSRGWACGYGVLLVLAFICAAVTRRNHGASSQLSEHAPTPALPREKISPLRRLRWVLLAFVPSSLMLGVTNYLSSEVAVVPLLWIVPLALYLLTFVLAFGRREHVPLSLLTRAFPILVVAVVVALNLQATEPLGGLMLLHLGAFFVAALLCHHRLAANRPDAANLTEFYLWLSVGGVLGGVFNAILAPLVFDSFAEYPIALVFACFVARPIAEREGTPSPTRGDWIAPAVLGGLTTALILLAQAHQLDSGRIAPALLFGATALVVYFFSRRPLRFALGIAALLLTGLVHRGEKGRTLQAERSFFGLHRVTLDPTGNYHLLVHGKTLHGMQSLDPARRGESLAYYHRTGPLGDVFTAYAQAPDKRIAVIGLGVGSAASFAVPGQTWTFFEIDPVVEKLARDARFFTYLRDSPAHPRVVLGDARLSLAHAPDERFDVLVVDAFSSDAIPLHLVTREALALDLARLAPGGVLAFHISNLHLDLEPVFARLARDASLACLVRDDTVVSAEEQALGKAPSIWLVMARAPADLAPLVRMGRWVEPRLDPSQPVWTDDYSSLIRIFRWR